MGKKTIRIDHNELREAIELLEEEGPLPSFNILCQNLTDTLDIDVSPSLIKSQIKEWGISTQTEAQRNRPPEKEEPPKECYSDMRTILVPSGTCPCRLNGTDIETVEKWVDDVSRYGINQGKNYTASAMCYFVRYEYDIFSPEYQQVREHIEAIMGVS